MGLVFRRRRRADVAEGGVLVELRDELAGQARYWARLADLEGPESLRRTCMAVKSHAFAQAAAYADETLGRRFGVHAERRER